MKKNCNETYGRNPLSVSEDRNLETHTTSTKVDLILDPPIHSDVLTSKVISFLPEKSALPQNITVKHSSHAKF